MASRSSRTTSGTVPPPVSPPPTASYEAFTDDEYTLAERFAISKHNNDNAIWFRDTEEGIRTSTSTDVPADPARLKQLVAAAICSYVVRHSDYPLKARLVDDEKKRAAAAHIEKTLASVSKKGLLGSTTFESFSPLVVQSIEKGRKRPPNRVSQAWKNRNKSGTSRFKPLVWPIFFAIFTVIYAIFFTLPGLLKFCLVTFLFILVIVMAVRVLLKKSTWLLKFLWILTVVLSIIMSLVVLNAVEKATGSISGGQASVVTPQSCPSDEAGCHQIALNGVSGSLSTLIVLAKICYADGTAEGCAQNIHWKSTDRSSTVPILDQLDWTAVGTIPYTVCQNDKGLPSIGVPRQTVKWCP